MAERALPACCRWPRGGPNLPTPSQSDSGAHPHMCPEPGLAPASAGQEEQLDERVGVEPETGAGEAQHPHPVL